MSLARLSPVALHALAQLKSQILERFIRLRPRDTQLQDCTDLYYVIQEYIWNEALSGATFDCMQTLISLVYMLLKYDVGIGMHRSSVFKDELEMDLREIIQVMKSMEVD